MDRADVTAAAIPGRFLASAAVATLALLAAAPALGGATSSVAATGVSFGTYVISLVTPTDSSGDVTVTCTYVPPGGAVSVDIVTSLSTGISGSYSPRQMAAGPARLNYNLFVDAARAFVWGNGLSGTRVATAGFTVGPGVGNGTRSAALPVYGRVPAQQLVGTGSYSDTIVVTVTF
jgi:spore coat protein U-like protein